MTNQEEKFYTQIDKLSKERLPEDKKSQILSAILEQKDDAETVSRVSKGLLSTLIGFSFLFVGGGVAFASQQSEPGDLLYPLEVHIIEPLIEVVQISTEAQFEYNKELIQERIDEIDVLQQEGEVSEVQENQVEELVNVYIENINQLDVGNAEKIKILELQLELRDTLSE